jgi:hypothetical protein
MTPIQSQKELIDVVEYIALNTSKMAEKIIGKSFPIKSLTVFSHSHQEFELLSQIIYGMGKPFNYNNGPRVELNNPIKIGDNKITHLRIRKPDNERPQVGCNDFETDYVAFKEECLVKCHDNLRLIVRPEYEMIEMRDDNFDVLAYVVSN